MKMYSELAKWWPLLSPVFEYEEEASLFLNIINKYKKSHAKTITTALELGSGGGSNAFYLKKHFPLTLCDMSKAMLQVSQKINPELTHVWADMRQVDLEKKFDFIFIHDAIMHINNKKDLALVFQTIKKHLNPNGLVMLVPDFIKETFSPGVDDGGTDHPDNPQQGIRFFEWFYDNDPDDDQIEADYTYLVKEKGQVSCFHDHMVCGLFSKDEWHRQFKSIGLELHIEEVPHSQLEPKSLFALVGV